MVHGSDGLDEITAAGPTDAWEIRGGAVEHRLLEPEDFAVNAVLDGARGPQRDVVLVNA